MENVSGNLRIVIYGAGAIGTSLYGLIYPHYSNIYLLARGENAKILKSNGLILYEQKNNNPEPISVNVIEDLNELSSIDTVIITVKNYDLEEVAKDISSKLGDGPVIVAMQNGVINQEILPKYFSKVIYTVIVFSAWRDKPDVFGYRSKGIIFLGTIDNIVQPIMEKIIKIMNLGVSTKITDKLQDAVHSKMIMNLNNAASALIDLKAMDDSTISIFRKIIINIILEGIQIIEAAGYEEFKLKKLPDWKSIRIANKIPEDMANRMFKENIKGMALSSMVQDIVLRQKNQSELESLNGYFIKLADSLGFKAPYNRTIYEICKEEFKKTPFKPLHVELVWKKIQEKLDKN